MDKLFFIWKITIKGLFKRIKLHSPWLAGLAQIAAGGRLSRRLEGV